MRKLIILSLLIVGCQKDYYLNDLRNTQEELSQVRDSLTSQLEMRDITITGLARENEETLRKAIEGKIIDIITDGYMHTGELIDMREFLLSFQEMSPCGLGEFCTDAIPIVIDGECYNNLDAFKQVQLLVHEVGHSYFNYLHPQDRDHAGYPPYAGGELEIMDATRWFNDTGEYIKALERFWSGEGQYVLPCSSKDGPIIIECYKE